MKRVRRFTSLAQQFTVDALTGMMERLGAGGLP